ncbi:protein GET1 [Polytolypa hystricis UAMH7299]|uniref:Protein GET1 n=1 Tax=Polytolypa hystricis (strain UAMH7299) TaxID=1447883 RepID=A0A2B7YI82_POLH7|nr:protein GET1 [Polytolypa hystricis UAMH7299]
MPSLLLVILLLHIVTYLINTIGASTIDSLLWLLYIKLPNRVSETAREQQRMKLEVVQLKREMNATSSQDEFAKWAKLRRRHDKALEQYETKNKALSEQKSSFDMAIKSVRWTSTTGLKLFLQFWYSKTPMFDLPREWLPWQVEWVLSFPRAPLGTVSIQIWGGACATVVPLVGDAVGEVISQVWKSSNGSTTGSGAKKASAEDQGEKSQ